MINYKTARKFGSLEFLAKQVVEGFITGLHQSPFHGFSVEFAEHRLYNSGESAQRVVKENGPSCWFPYDNFIFGCFCGEINILRKNPKRYN